QVLEDQGYRVRGFLELYERISYDLVEPRTPRMFRLSVTVALEHFTAILAENALRERLLDHAHPALQRLLFWHAAEEIEHKAVALDVFQRMGGTYRMRMAGLAMATLGLSAFWAAATGMLLLQDQRARRPGKARRSLAAKLYAERRIFREHGGILQRVFV